MKQKVVVKVHCMNGRKSRPKALQIVAGVTGVESFALQGEAKDQIEVTGEDIDAVVLTKMLRKNFGYVDLVAFGPVQNPVAPAPPSAEPVAPVWPNDFATVPQFVAEMKYIDDPACCSIM